MDLDVTLRTSFDDEGWRSFYSPLPELVPDLADGLTAIDDGVRVAMDDGFRSVNFHDLAELIRERAPSPRRTESAVR